MARTKVVAIAGLSFALILAGCSKARLGPPPAGIHKRASLAPITFYLDGSASDALELGVREAFQLWSDSSSFKFAYGGKVRPAAARDGRDEVILMKHWPDELPIDAPAWCQLYLDASGSIVEADILLNAQAFSFTTSREAKAGSLYVEDVLAREIGRSLGIDTDSAERDGYRRAEAGDGFEPGIDPAEMAAYLSLYAAGQ